MAATQGFRVLLLLLMVSWWCAGVNVTLQEPRDLPCPVSLDIMPCTCTAYTDFTMDMDCSAVESEQQLAQIFDQHFDFLDFRKLIIEYNYNLQVLRKGALGDTTYEEIEIHNTGLETVETGALAKSFPTAKRLLFYSNSISSFPFQEIEHFVYLHELRIDNNNILGFPFIRSASLEILEMSVNPIMDLPSTAFTATTSLKYIGLSYAGLPRVLAGTFFGLYNLEEVQMHGNHLTDTAEGSFVFASNRYRFLYLSYNNIQTVAVNSFSGFNGGYIFLEDNKVQELLEQVWRPLLERNVYLYLRDNPLYCGCEVAWIVLNPTFLNLISTDTKCENGEYFHDLDPDLFEALCF